MTVNTENITSGPYVGNDIADTFSYTFRVSDKTQLAVYETDDVGVQILLTVDTDYTVNNVGDDAGGTITRTAGALPTDYEWYIRSDYNETQLTAFESQGAFFPDLHESAMDKLTFLIQQMRDSLNRSVRLPDSFSESFSTLLTPVNGAVLGWVGNTLSNVFLNFETDGDVLIFDNLASAVASSPAVGKTVRIKGRITPGDGGGADYLTAVNQVVDGYVNHLAANSNALLLQHDGVIRSEQCGAQEAPFDSKNALQAVADNWTTLGLSKLIIGSTNDDLEVSYKVFFTDDDVSIDVACTITNTYTASDGRGSGVFCFSKTGEVDWNDANPGAALLAYGGARQKNVTLRSIQGRQTLDGGGSGVVGFVPTTTNTVQLDTVSFANSEDCFVEGFNLTNGLYTNVAKISSRHVTTQDCISTDPVHDNNFTAAYDAGVVTAAKTTDRNLMANHKFIRCKAYGGAFAGTALKARGVLFEDCEGHDNETGFGAEEIAGHVIGDLGHVTFRNTRVVGATRRPYQLTTNGIRMEFPVAKDCVAVIADPDGADINEGSGIHASDVGDIEIYHPDISGMPNKGINLRAMTGSVKIFEPVINDVTYDSINCVQTINKVDIFDMNTTGAGRFQVRIKGNLNDRDGEIALYSCAGEKGYKAEEFKSFKTYDSKVIDEQILFFNGELVELHDQRSEVTQGVDLATRGINIQNTIDVGKIYNPVIEQGSREHIINSATVRYGYVNDEEEVIGGSITGDAAVRPQMNLTGASASVTGNLPQTTIIWNTNIAGGQPMGWRVVTEGTNKTLSGAVTVAATTAFGDRVITVNNVENIVTGNYLSIVGEGAIYRVLHVDSVNSKIYLSDQLTSDRNGNAVTFTVPTTLALPNN